jgi:hypothetical protein
MLGVAEGKRRLKATNRNWILSAVFAFCVLIVVAQSKLPPNTVASEMPPLSLELDVGSPAEDSTDGTFHWVTQTKSTLILANNTASPIKASLKGLLSVSPCSHEIALSIRSKEIKLIGEIGPLQRTYRIDLPVSLRPFERRVAILYVSGVGCPTVPSDGRVIFSKLSRLTLLG